MVTARQVSEAAEVLDEEKPEWAGAVNVQKLDMNDPCTCVLGQLYTNYCYAPSKLIRREAFCSDIKKKYWINEIQKRRKPQPRQ